jgi:hypothetical protein
VKRAPARRWAAGIGAALAVGACWFAAHLNSGQEVPLVDIARDAPASQNDTAAGLCPWRSPEADRKAFFPASTGSQNETLVLSRQRLEIARRLGRPATGEDIALQIHRILRGERPVGAVVTRRVRGESGVIELVLAVGTDGRVVGAKLQRQREPEEVVRALRSDAFLGAFPGKTASSDWQLGKGFGPVPEAARTSAAALLDGARTALILLDMGSIPSARAPHIHT